MKSDQKINNFLKDFHHKNKNLLIYKGIKSVAECNRKNAGNKKPPEGGRNNAV